MKIVLKVKTMTQVFFSLLILLNFSAVFAQETVVKGKISGLSNDTLLYNLEVRDENNKFVDHRPITENVIVSKNGKFSLKLPLKYQGVLKIFPLENVEFTSSAKTGMMSYEDDYMTLFLTPKGKYTVKASLKDGGVSFMSKGDKMNEMFSENNSLRKELNIKRAQVISMQIKAKTQAEREKNFPLLEEIGEGITKTKIDFINQNPNSPISAYYLTEMSFRMNEKNVDEYVAMLGEGALNSFLGKEFMIYVNVIKEEPIRKKAAEERKKKQTAMNGKQAPDFSLKDIDGNTFTLSQMKGKYILIDFWGSWCGWCFDGFVELERYNKKYKDRMNVVTIAFSDTHDKWKQAVEEHKLTNWINLLDDKNEVSKMFHVNSAPHYVLISPEGVVLQRIDRLTELDKILELPKE